VNEGDLEVAEEEDRNSEDEPESYDPRAETLANTEDVGE
jgi:hypothetical protein